VKRSKLPSQNREDKEEDSSPPKRDNDLNESNSWVM